MASLPLFHRRDDAAPLFSVSELTALIQETLETGFAEIGLRGEVSNIARPRSGHVYFSVKDDSAQIKAVLWRSAASRLVFDLTDGLAVRAWGSVTVYAPRGEYQIIVQKIEPEGIGPLELALRQTMARLAAEGLFDTARKRPLPKYPRRIVVVTSPTGAAIRDFLQVVGRRWSATEILVVPTRVQGAGAAEEIAAAIGLACQVAGAELVVIARGGGSLEDLWPFNEEPVARAIFAASLPVVSAIGHEVDVTITDLVADRRALTPSEAGELCVPDGAEVRRRLDHLRDRLASSARAHFRQARQRLDLLSDHARRALARDLDQRRQELARLAAQLDALSPLAVLARGYSLTLLANGTRVLRSAEMVQPGDLIQTLLASGAVVSRVDSTSPSREPRDLATDTSPKREF